MSEPFDLGGKLAALEAASYSLALTRGMTTREAIETAKLDREACDRITREIRAEFDRLHALIEGGSP